MLIVCDDRSDAPIRLVSVDHTDAGELEAPARAIEIVIDVIGKGLFSAYGIDFADGSYIVTTIGSVPAAALKRASEITEQWAAGTFSVPFHNKASEDH